jgi:hypothetical protein
MPTMLGLGDARTRYALKRFAIKFAIVGFGATA